MTEAVEYFLESWGKGYDLIKRTAQPLFMDLLKVNALSTAVSGIGLILIALIVLSVAGGEFLAMMTAETYTSAPVLPAFGAGVLLAILLAFIILVVSSLIEVAISSVSYNVVENRSANKPTAILAQLRKNFFPVIGLSFITWLLMLVVGVPLLIMVSVSAIGGPLVCLTVPLAILVFIALVIVLQFSTMELILGGKGVVDSMKASFSLVRANLASVIVLDIVLAVILLAVYAGNEVMTWILEIVPYTLSFFGLPGMLLGTAIYYLLLFVVSVFFTTAGELVTLPVRYHFWKGIRR